MTSRPVVRLVRPGRLDACCALVVLVLGLGEVATGQVHGPQGLGCASTLVYAGCLLLRRSSLWAAVLIGFGTIVLTYAGGLSQEDYLASVVAGLVLLTWVGFSLRLPEALLGFGFAYVCVAATNGPTAFSTDGWLLLVLGGAWAAGRALRTRRLLIEDLQRTTSELAESRHELANRAVADERLRIARDIHDVIAHSVTVMLVQAEVAERVLPPGAEARQAVVAVQDTGRQAIVELRQLLGVLRPDPGPTGTAPQPTLADLPALLASYAEAGLTVTCRARPPMVALPGTVELTAYRVAQEALTNVLRHSAARTASLDVRAGDGVLTVRITDPGPAKPASGPPGHGLEGMRERVAACGGTLATGQDEDGFCVSATISLESP